MTILLNMNTQDHFHDSILKRIVEIRKDFIQA